MMTIQKFHLYSLKVSAHVKISVECFENSRGRKFPPPRLVARLPCRHYDFSRYSKGHTLSCCPLLLS